MPKLNINILFLTIVQIQIQFDLKTLTRVIRLAK